MSQDEVLEFLENLEKSNPDNSFSLVEKYLEGAVQRGDTI